MRKKLQNFMIKAFSLCLAFILVFPTNLFAMGLDNTKTRKYKASASIMGLAQADTTGQNDNEVTDQTLLETEITKKETDEYLIEKSARLSKTTGQIDYQIKVIAKDKRAEDKISASFAISQNTDLKDLKLEKVCQIHTDHSQEEIKYQEQRPSILYTNDSFETLGVTTENKDLVYYLSAKLTDEALAAINDKSPIMDLTFSIGAHLQDSYSLSIEKLELKGENGQENKSIQTLKEEPVQQIKAIFKEKTSSLLGEKPAEITWTDYILPTEKTTYDIKLDQNQELSQVKIDFYQASEKGYVIKDEHTQTMDFAQSLNLQIPKDQIAKIEVSTKVKGNPKSFTYNNKEIPNPYYKEQTRQAEEKSDDKENTEKDEDPLPLDPAKEKTSAKSSDDRIADDKDISTDTLKEESQSAIELNKEAYIQNVENKEPVNQIAKALASYNNNEIDFDQVKASVESISKDQNLGESQTQEIIEALLIGLNEENHKAATINPADLTVDIKEAMEEEEPKLTDAEIKDLIKEEFAKKDAGQITEEELETSLATIREDNNIDKEAFFNILADLYKNAEIENDGEENPSEKEESIDTEKTKEEALEEKLAEEDLSTEDFIAFLKSYVKSYDIKEDQLEALLKGNQVEVEKVIGDFTIDEIVAAAYLEGLNPHIFAGTNKAILDADFSNEKFITELEYSAETLTRSTNEDKLFEIVKKSQSNLSHQQIRSDYVGWKINIPGKDNSGNDITEIKKDKYEYDYMNFSIYAPAGQSLEDYRVVVEDGEGRPTSYSGSMTEKKGEHYLYKFSIPKDKLSEKGYNIYVVAKAEKKRQNYAIGLKIAPDKNYVTEIADNYKEKFEELKKKYPLLIKWIDTSAANPYRNGIELLDTRMVYLEPKGWQDLFPYNGFRSLDYNDNVTDTDNIKNTVSMFGNIDKDGNITWTISETFPAEKLENKNTVGLDAYSVKSDSGNLGKPSVQILVPNNEGGYTVTNLDKNVELATLQEKIGSKPGTIVNYTYKDTAKNKEEFTTLILDSGKAASIAYKPSLLQREEGAEKDTTGLAYLHKVQEHKDGPGYEVALANDQAHTLTAFIPKNPSANPRYNDPAFKDTGVVVFCLNPGKPEPTRQYKFNGTITKGEWSTDKGSWAKHGRDLASLATASEAKASPLYKGQANDSFYASLYAHILRMYWYGQEMAKEYQLDQQSYYKIIQYNLYYWIAGENYAENFRNGGGYNPNYFSSAEYSYAQGLKNRISQGKDWDKVNYDEDIEIYYYGHDKSRSYQNTITGDTKRKSKKGSVTVNKIDQNGKKLSGAYFQLLDENRNPIKTLVTDANGEAVFEDLDYGTYYIKEVQGPKGYQFTEEISKVTVGEKQAHVSFTAKNTKNEIEFRKVDENGLAMGGVVFELRQNGRPISDQEKTSGKDGKFSWKELTPGYYEVVEKKVNNPLYSENEGRVVASFRVDENNKIQDKKIYFPKDSNKDDIVNKKNEGKPIGIEFTKVDLNTGYPLEGAEFVLEYRKPDSSIFRELPGSRRRSNSEGKLVWNDLVDGDYRVIETKAPDGNYDTDLNLGEKATFTIAKNQNGYYEIKNVTPENKEITNKEKPEEPKEYFGEFEFSKVDSEDKKPLQGVEFTLTSDGQVGPEKDKFYYKVSKTTDADGKIEYTKLYPGTYTLTETKQLPGYKENTKTWTVVVDDEGKATVKADGESNYNLEFTGNDTALRNTNYAYIKETLEQNPNNPNGMIYRITIKPKRELYQVVLGFDRWSGLSSYGLEQNSYIRKSSLPEVGQEKTFKYYISIKDVETFKKNTPTSPIGSIQVWYDEIGNYESVGSKPKFTLKSNSESSGLTITNDKEKPEPASLTIKKVDSETNEGLEGAKFRLYHTRNDAENNGHYIQEVESNEHGYAIFDSPEIQNNTTYYVKEIAPPEGYKITSAITEVKSSATEDNTINAEIPNEKNNARFELYKKGDDGEYLKGVIFKLTNKTTNESVELTTDGNGYIFYDKLKPKTSYELEEIKSAQGYTRNEDKATITVDKSGNVTVNENDLAKAKEGENQGLVLVATNIKQPSIDFVKQDGANKKALYGAEFVLYKDGEKVTNSLTSSDKEGKFGFDNLEDGSYTVYETASPEGYPYLEEKLKVATFTVKDGKVTELKTNPDFGETQTSEVDTSKTYVIYNKVNEIKFKKVNNNKEALKRAKFKLDRVWDSYDDSGKLQPNRETVLEDIETLEDGIISLSATKAGRYQLVETQAPQGYKQINTNNAAGGQIVAEFTVERITLDIKNVLVGNKYIQDMKDYSGDLEIVNKKDVNGKFQVNKVGKNGDSTIPLTGAKFLLKDIESGQYVMTDGTFTTNSGAALTNGDATVNYVNLPVGKYELREFKSPDGYVRTINTWKVVVNDDGTTTISENPKLDTDVDAEINNGNTSSPELKLVNKSNEIEFTKIDSEDSETEKPLAGVEFEIWWDQQGDKNNTDVKYKKYVRIQNPDKTEDAEDKFIFTTDEKGKFKLSNLKTGHYKIYETKIPVGYKVEDKLVDNEPIKDAKGEFVNEFFVDIDGDIKKNDKGIVGGEDDVLVTTIKNTPITGKFRVQKVGEDGVDKLEGADFELYKVDENGDKVGKAIESKPIDGVTGLVEFTDLKKGKYLLEETKAPKGYVMSAAKWEVTVEDDGKLNISSDDESSYFTRTDDTLTLNVVNKKPTYPSTGGTGVKIAFALIGTAVMITALAFFGILNTSKTRRR
ncbi:SpaA isopeptide-forming pilin-related protein [Anaerococcus sp. Marseille-Q7828]|uniref:SpaA isopeptide-forming pilin-related protein n=1 Tax=Anaerococcus sp. Marseille-Q7828 TaxID=3036300 RepID=UPI0024AD15F0|nr:SpaA isopeptide-forming pilin-related protein [Anaerococcus sp. Marseille-Q7828]